MWYLSCRFRLTRTRTLRFLFYVEQDYSFAILRPLQAEARAQGHEVRWLLLGDASAELLGPEDVRVENRAAARAWRPDAVFVPGDRVPSWIPGLKVQVFHGLNEDKRGNIYPERGLFDLYCTEGPPRTNMLAPLAEKRGYFRVVETGWLKLDALFNYEPGEIEFERPQIFFGSTFTPRLSGAEALWPEIRRLAGTGRWQWLVSMHPKMDPATVEKYRRITGPNLAYFGPDHAIELLHRADVIVSDNSSILQEFLLLQKPVVTFRNRAPQACMIDITEPQQLEAAIERALAPDEALMEEIRAYGPRVTSWFDGRSSARVIAAVEEMFDSGWKDKKPLNLWRNLRMWMSDKPVD